MALAQAQNGGRGSYQGGRGGNSGRGRRRGGRRGGGGGWGTAPYQQQFGHHPYHNHNQPIPQPIFNIMTPPLMDQQQQQFNYPSPANPQTQTGGGGQHLQGAQHASPQPTVDITAVATLEVLTFHASATTLLIGDGMLSLIQKRPLPESFQVVCLPGIRIINLEEKLPNLLQSAPATLERIAIFGGLSDLRCGAGAVYARSLTSLVKAVLGVTKDVQVIVSLIPLFTIKNPPTSISAITAINGEIRELVGKLKKKEGEVKILDLERPFLSAQDPSSLTMNDGFTWSQKGAKVLYEILQSLELLPK